MKNRFFVLLPFFALALLLNTSCRSSKQAYQQGDYYDACTISIKDLRNNPKNKKAAETLTLAYPLLLKTTQLNIDNILSLNSIAKYRTVYNEYVKLNNIYQSILTCPEALRIIPSPQSFIKQQNDVQKLAFNEIIAEADGKLAEGTRMSARNAYYLYTDALRFDPASDLAKSKQMEALDKAIVKVVLEQIPVVKAYDFSCSFFYDQVFTSLNNDRRNLFLQFYRPEEAVKMKIVPDHVITMSFDDFVVGQVSDKKVITDLRRDSVIVGSVKMPDGSNKDVFNTVTAKLTVNTRTLESKGLIAVQIVDFRTKQLLAHQKFEGVYVWQDDWGTFNGDSRALSEKQLRICNKQQISPPAPQYLFLEFTKPLYNSTINYLSNFYSATIYRM